jgi:hypothetical protein
MRRHPMRYAQVATAGDTEIVEKRLRMVAVFLVAISLVLIFLSPVTSASIIGFDSELATWWLAGLFFVISLGLIIVKSRR